MNTHQHNIGKYFKRETCRFCEGTNLEQILDFGNMPLAGGFLREEDIIDEKHYPLSLNLCKDCFLVQISNVVPAEVLFNEKYFFYSSQIGSLVKHFNEFAIEINDRFLKNKTNPSVFELGCNDGVLLKPLAELGVKAMGVDPATNVVRSITSNKIAVINDFFSEQLATKIEKEHGRFDLFVSSYSFAHIDNMIDIMKGIKCLLKEDGVFIFEIYYLGTLMDEFQYDMIYHEHMSYYSLKALSFFMKKFDMEIFDVQFVPGIRSGSVRFFTRNIGKRSEMISKSVHDMVKFEEEKGFEKIETYIKYAEQVKLTKKNILELLERLKKEGKEVIGYGASGRGTIIMNFCGIDKEYIEFVVDDAPAKHGFLTPGTHVPIKPWSVIDQENPPDYAILFAWAFTDEVLKKRQDFIDRGGKFIIPLPEVKVYPS